MGKIYNDSRKVIIWTKLITKQIDSFAIISKDSDMTAAKSAINIAKKFTRSGFHVKLISPLISKHFDTVSISDNLSDSNIKCIIVVGGDGTILKTVRLMKQQIPILGINFGGRGILTELTPVEISKAIEKIKHGEIFFDRRKRIKLFLNSNKSKAINIAITNKNKNKIKFISFVKPLRFTLINLENGPAVSDIFFILGKKNSILRLNNYIKG